MGIVDATYRFTYLDVGAIGRTSDGGVFNQTSFFKSLTKGDLHLPAAEPLPGRDKPIPYLLVGDDAFALSNNLMKPYSKKSLTGLERIFNYRLSRGRRIIENAFGILAHRFGVFGRPIRLGPGKTRQITIACCALHNFLITRNSNVYSTATLVDSYDDEGNVVNGDWRQAVNTDNNFHPLEIRRTFDSNQGIAIREELTQYFVHEGELDFQYGRI